MSVRALLGQLDKGSLQAGITSHSWRVTALSHFTPQSLGWLPNSDLYRGFRFPTPTSGLHAYRVENPHPWVFWLLWTSSDFQRLVFIFYVTCYVINLFSLANERRICLRHDFLLGVDVFLLSRVQDVFLLQALKSIRLLVLNILHLKTQTLCKTTEIKECVK